MKVCSKCKKEKSFDCFSPDNGEKANKDGLRSICKECRSAANLAWHYKNREKSIENRKLWGEKNKEKVKSYSIKYLENNKDYLYKKTSEWNRLNKSKKAKNASKKRYLENASAPKWLTHIHLAQIQEFYDIALAKTTQTGIVYHVDHIHPIQGNGFNGLHVPWNLQILTAKENVSKKNNIPQSDKNIFWSAI